MNRRLILALVVPVVMTPAVSTIAQDGAPPISAMRHIESDPATGTSAAVVVNDLPLVHTAMLLPPEDAGKGAGDPAVQLDRLFGRLQAVLQSGGSDMDRIVKLNLYIAREDVSEIVWNGLAAKFSGGGRPAVSLVVTSLPRRGALIGLDAVAAARNEAAGDSIKRLDHAAVLPLGSRIYVSGQAAQGTLREATRKTLEGLAATLKHCGRSDQDVVQVKCFLRPMDSVAEVQDEIARHYGKDGVPPVSFVEWRSTLPIEIELVAWGGPAQAGAPQALEFITPPGMNASPVFSRVARIHRGGSIYFSDLFGPAQTPADQQLQAAFERLRSLLEKSGSDLTHLAKATYYITDDEISRAHNAIRPRFYDRERPPAASKALISATGRAGVRYTMDMIAVPIVGQ